MIYNTYIQDCLKCNYFLQALQGEHKGIIIPIYECDKKNLLHKIPKSNLYPDPINHILTNSVCIKYLNKYYLYDTSSNKTKRIYYSFPFIIGKTIFKIKKRPTILLNPKQINNTDFSNKKQIIQRLIFMLPLLLSSIFMGIYYTNIIFRLIFIIPMFSTIILGTLFLKPKLFKENTLYFSYLHCVLHPKNLDNEKQSFNFHLKYKNFFVPNKKLEISAEEQIFFKGKYAKEYLAVFCVQMKTLHNLNYYFEKDIIVFHHNNVPVFKTTINSNYFEHNFYPTKIIYSSYALKHINKTWSKILINLNIVQTKTATKNFSDHINVNTNKIIQNWENNKTNLSIPIGISENKIEKIDLQKQGPHCLISGSTGSGKSEALITIILSLAVHYHPANLKLILIDYKGGISFEKLNSLPHVENIYTDLDQAFTVHAIKSLKFEIQKREKLFLKTKTTNIDEYNCKTTNTIPKILVIIDEFLALSENNFEIIKSLIDLTIRGRALGIHLILATQNTIGTIPNTIKTNINLQIYMHNNEHNQTNKYNEKRVEKIPGKAHINSKEIQFLWANPQNKCMQKILSNIEQTKNYLNKNTIFKNQTKIISEMLPTKLYMTNHNILFKENKQIPVKTNLLEHYTNSFLNTPIIGMKTISNIQGIDTCVLEETSHNLQIPNYCFKEYLQTIIFALNKTHITLLITEEKGFYNKKFPAHTSNLLIKSPHEILLITKIIDKYKKEKIPLNIIIDNWEITKEYLLENNINPQTYMEKLLTYNKKKNHYLLVFSHKPLRNFCHYYYCAANNDQENILWKNTNIKNISIKNTLGKIISTSKNQITEIQLAKLYTCSKEIKNTLAFYKTNLPKYDLPLPKMFLYNYENTNLFTKEKHSLSFILGIEELSFKHINVKYLENNIIIVNNDYERDLFLKTFLKIPAQMNMQSFLKTENIQIISPLTNTNIDTNIFMIPLVILKTPNLETQILNTQYCVGKEETILEHIQPDIPLIIIMNSNQFLSSQNLVYKTYNHFCNTIIFSPTRKTLELFGITSKNNFSTTQSITNILFIKNGEHSYLQLAQIT